MHFDEYRKHDATALAAHTSTLHIGICGTSFHSGIRRDCRGSASAGP